MKKRTLALALALGCVFMSPTLSYGEENAEVVSEIEEDSSTDEGNNNSWGKVAVVDDFGDATGQSVISTVVSGTFSNTATTGSDLLVTAYINFDEFDYCYDLSFKLLEYKDTPATYFSSDSKELKIKVGSINTVYEYGLLGEEPNGNVYVSGSSGEDIVKCLYEGNDIRCVLNLGSSKYSFALEAGNIAELIDEGGYGAPLDEEGRKERKSKHEIEEAQESSRKKQEAELAQAEKVIKPKDDFIAAYVNHTDADNDYESGFYYFKAHADEFETLTEEELSSIFPCRFRYYTVNWAIGGTTGAGDLYEYDADGNSKQLGSFGTDDSYRTREEINPNWPEINGSWRIEDGKLIRTITSGNQEKRYIVKSLDRDGYYLLCFESATGEVNAVMMIVLYDENNMPLYEFTEN